MQQQELNWKEIQQVDALIASDLLKILDPWVRDETQLRELLHTLVEQQHHRLIVAGRAGRWHAFAAIRIEKGRAEFCLFSVRESLRGQGMGCYLMDCLCQLVAAAGASQLCADLVGQEVSELEMLIPFLKRMGFKALPENKMRWVKSV